ncbi:MAG: damage-inducible protein CinA [Microbacteriaceae bacterium]|nr:damage-inducible protein CinA [Microbacteriaceae bacterium]
MDDAVEAGGAAEAVVALLTDLGLTIAVAESLTGGLVVAELVSVPGASVVVVGGVVAYDTRIKQSVLGVDAALLAQHGAVHAEVARQMADRVRSVLAVAGRPADVGLATTGVAGPGPQDGHPAGTVFLGIAIGETVETLRLELVGDRRAVRQATVSELLLQLKIRLASR